MKKQPKAKRVQFLLRIEAEEQTRLAELAAQAGFTSAQQFVIEAMSRYAEELARVMIDENRELEEVKQRQRDALREQLQSSRR